MTNDEALEINSTLTDFDICIIRQAFDLTGRVMLGGIIGDRRETILLDNAENRSANKLVSKGLAIKELAEGTSFTLILTAKCKEFYKLYRKLKLKNK